jgi:hypothetical protein
MATSNPQEYLTLLRGWRISKASLLHWSWRINDCLKIYRRFLFRSNKYTKSYTRGSIIGVGNSNTITSQSRRPRSYKGAKISLPAKFNGSRAHFRGFIHQVRLVIQMHPMQYPTDSSRVRLVGTLLIGIVMVCSFVRSKFSLTQQL